jgi:hypothetical protein
MRLAVSTTLCIALLAISAASVLANTPDPLMSTADPKVGRSPKNEQVTNPAVQYVLRMVVRNSLGQVIAGYAAQNDMAFEVLGPNCQNPFLVMADGPSDGGGNIQWGVPKLDQLGGSCTGTVVARIRSLTLGPFKNYDEVTSPNEDGGATGIDLVDLVIFQQAFVSGLPANWYQGDLTLGGGPPDLVDLVFFQNHFVAP